MLNILLQAAGLHSGKNNPSQNKCLSSNANSYGNSFMSKPFRPGEESHTDCDSSFPSSCWTLIHLNSCLVAKRSSHPDDTSLPFLYRVITLHNKILRHWRQFLPVYKAQRHNGIICVFSFALQKVFCLQAPFWCIGNHLQGDIKGSSLLWPRETD